MLYYTIRYYATGNCIVIYVILHYILLYYTMLYEDLYMLQASVYIDDIYIQKMAEGISPVYNLGQLLPTKARAPAHSGEL